jgi:drug/metabolite transporter (DMT)-like permease
LCSRSSAYATQATALVSIPTSAVLLWLLVPLLSQLARLRPARRRHLHGCGLLFPAVVTLLTFEANRRMGPGMSGALSDLTPIFAVLPAFPRSARRSRAGR